LPGSHGTRMKTRDEIARDGRRTGAVGRRHRVMSLGVFAALFTLIACLHLAFWALTKPDLTAASVDGKLPSVSYNRFAEQTPDGLRVPEARIRADLTEIAKHANAVRTYASTQGLERVPEIAAKRLGKRLFDARAGERQFVIEGGGIEVNGRGTLLTTEECYLDPKVQVRNPGLDRAGFEAALRENLGVTNVLWLAAGPKGDDTHGHIDDICRFVNPRTLVLIKETNRKDANYRPLAENWERVGDLRLEDGSKPEVVALPMPGPLYFDGDRLPASYANFYISNAAVLVPTFNDPNDRVALGILGELFAPRPVIGIHAVDLVLGFGTLHCLTQQQPTESAR